MNMDQDYILDEKERERRRLIRKEMKRKSLIKQRIAFIATLAVVILILVLIISSCSKRKAQREAELAHQAAQDAVQQEVVTAKATLAAFGDVMCYNEQIMDALTSSGAYDFSPAFEAIAPYLQSADLTVGNLELNFCGPNSSYVGFPNFRAPESLAQTLAEAGVDILQTANTYSLQNGISGLQSTIRYVQEQNMIPLGTYAATIDKRRDEGVQFKTVNGIKFAFLAFTKGMNNMTLPEDADYAADVLFEDYATNYEIINKDGLLRSVEAAKAGGADVIVAMLHWGTEFELKPDAKQEEIAQLLFQNGVDVILGSHSHLVGPMVKKSMVVNGREKDVFVAYSLGNFFSAMTDGTSQDSLILNLEFSMDSETGKVTISDVSYLPVYLIDKGEGADVRYEVLPIRSAKESSLFSEQDEVFDAAIAALKTQTASSFDSGK
ncbi:MAG: CapA family protein [Oscillospiraceae bacterium]|nr:CapA family protein [Oscillospiraceae bacterium]